MLSKGFMKGSFFPLTLLFAKGANSGPTGKLLSGVVEKQLNASAPYYLKALDQAVAKGNPVVW